MKVNYIEEVDIEAEANHLIKLFESKHGSIDGYMIPVEEIAEHTLGYHFEVIDLKKEYPNSEVHGRIDFDTNFISIHCGLEPIENPSYIGRFNSTIGHECGHDVLHKEQFLESLKQGSLFSDNKQSSILCRKSDAEEPIEWQANCFSSYFTMPKDRIFKLWKEIFGSSSPKFKASFKDEFHPMTADTKSVDELINIYLKNYARSKVGVSSEALRIRFEKMDLLVSDKLSAEAIQGVLA